MKTLRCWILFWFVGLLALTATACSCDVKYVKQEVETGRFYSLKIGNCYDAVFEASDTYSITLEIPENILDYARTKVEEGHVHLLFDTKEMTYRERRSLCTHRPRVFIHAPSFKTVSLLGGASMKMDGRFIIEDGEIEILGASVLSADHFFVGKLHVEVLGASSFDVEELKAGQLDLEVLGASSCRLSSAEIDTLDVELLGASTCCLTAFAGCADLEVMGASTLEWKPLNDRVGERLHVEAMGASMVNADKVKFQHVRSESLGMSTVRVSRNK